MRFMGCGGLFERLVRDAQGATDLAAFRSSVLVALAGLIGADSASLMDPLQMRLPPWRAKSRVGLLHMDDARLSRLFFANRARYDRSGERLLRAMKPGWPVIDSDVYDHSERERLELYTDILLPQGTRTILGAFIRHRGRTLGQLVLKRHGRCVAFRDRDASSLWALLPAVALADAGFQHSSASCWMGADPSVCADTRPLGSRETEVALLVSKGMRNGEIAMLLGTSCETVKKQVRSVFGKLGVSNRAELAGFLTAQRTNFDSRRM
jgi:DNA-binding CsgD family transcriptional regulator